MSRRFKVNLSRIPDFVTDAPDVAWGAIEIAQRLMIALFFLDDGENYVLDRVMEEIYDFEEAHPEYSDYFLFVGLRMCQRLSDRVIVPIRFPQNHRGI